MTGNSSTGEHPTAHRVASEEESIMAQIVRTWPECEALEFSHHLSSPGFPIEKAMTTTGKAGASLADDRHLSEDEVSGNCLRLGLVRLLLLLQSKGKNCIDSYSVFRRLGCILFGWMMNPAWTLVINGGLLQDRVGFDVLCGWASPDWWEQGLSTDGRYYYWNWVDSWKTQTFKISMNIQNYTTNES